MSSYIDLIEETIEHLQEGARSVRAYTDDKTYIITRESDHGRFVVTLEEPGFPKEKTDSLESYFADVFGIEAKY